ncbi:hypothetical protein J5N58_25695 [Rhizobium cremeum]|nr:flagellin [Rhizobium cremeum]MCJ8003080.1 hypothetical protein [Rhizobium cremeum]
MVADSTASNTVVVDGFIRNNDGTVKVTTAEYAVGSYALFATIATGIGSGGILGSVMAISLTSASTTGDISAYLDQVESALAEMTIAGAALGAMITRIELQDDFAAKLSDAIESGVSRLVDADMEEESAKLSALQTQQQLAIQSLSIANSSSQNILTLFQQ